MSKAAPVMPCAEAEIDVEPFAATAARAVVAPVESIAATAALDDPKVNEMPDITLLSVSYAVALYDRVRPSAATVNVSLLNIEKPAESRDTTMRVIGVRTFSVATPTVAPDVALTCVEPKPTPVATPAAVIDEMADDAVLQVNTGCAAKATPSPSTALAANGNDAAR